MSANLPRLIYRRRGGLALSLFFNATEETFSVPVHSTLYSPHAAPKPVSVLLTAASAPSTQHDNEAQRESAGLCWFDSSRRHQVTAGWRLLACCFRGWCRLAATPATYVAAGVDVVAVNCCVCGDGERLTRCSLCLSCNRLYLLLYHYLLVVSLRGALLLTPTSFE